MSGEPFIVEMAVLLLIAFVLGGLCGFLVKRWLASRQVVGPETAQVAATESENDVARLEGSKPRLLKKARGGVADDLKKINGIGAKIETLLNELGVFHYDQIAAWDEAAIAWVDERLAFHGRVEREDWVGQAKELVAKAKALNG